MATLVIMKYYTLSFNSFYHSRWRKRKLLTCLLISVLINVKVLSCPTTETSLLWLKFCRLLPLVLLIKSNIKTKMGTALAQRLRCCATNRKVAGSITDGVIGVFQ